MPHKQPKVSTIVAVDSFACAHLRFAILTRTDVQDPATLFRTMIANVRELRCQPFIIVFKLLVVEQGDGGGEEATKGLMALLLKGRQRHNNHNDESNETTPDHVQFPSRFVSK
jgi:hypothetical protein